MYPRLARSTTLPLANASASYQAFRFADTIPSPSPKTSADQFTTDVVYFYDERHKLQEIYQKFFGGASDKMSDL